MERFDAVHGLEPPLLLQGRAAGPPPRVPRLAWAPRGGPGVPVQQLRPRRAVTHPQCLLRRVVPRLLNGRRLLRLPASTYLVVAAESASQAMSIQGQILELRVTGCRRLRDTELFSRQDPYVIVEYATTKLRTRTCTDGGRNPSFDEKFNIPLVEGLRELNVLVWNSNTINNDDFIGSCRVPLNKVLTNGHDDASWPLQTRRMKSAGEVNLIMHFDKNKMGAAPSAYGASSASYPAPAGYPAAAPHQAYPTPGHAPYPAPSAYSMPPPQQPYPAPSAYSVPPPQQPYPQHGYPPTSQPPQPYGQQYPPQPYGQPQPSQPYGQPYPPQPYGQPYPPPSTAQSPYPPAPYPGAYPPRPY